MSVIVVHDRVHRVVRLALPGEFHILVAGGCGALLVRLTQSWATVLVVPPDHDAAERIDIVLAELQTRAPSLLVIVVIDGGSTSLVNPYWHQVEILEADSPAMPATLQRLIRASTLEARVANAAAAVSADLSPEVSALVRRAVLDACTAHTVRDWIASTGLSRRVVERRCRSRLGMSPERLLLWGRVLVAAIMLESTLRRVTDVALEVGYDDASALTRLCTKLVGVPPRRLVGAGGSALVVARWRAAITGISESGGGTFPPQRRLAANCDALGQVCAA